MDANLLEYAYTAIAVAFLLCGLYIANRRNFPLIKSVLFWVFFGISFNLFSLSWIYSVYPFPGALEHHTQIAILAILHVLSSIVAGICFGIVGIVFHTTNTAPLFRLIVVPISIVLSEILRALSLSALYMGNNMKIGLDWQAGTLGNALSSTPLVEFAYLGGAFGLTYVLSYLLCLCIAWQRLKKTALLILPVLTVYVYIHFFVPINGPGETTTIGLMETNFDNEDFSKYPSGKIFTDHHTLIDGQIGTLLPYSPDIIVLPEDTRYLAYDGNGSSIHQDKRRMLVVDGGLSMNGNDFLNSSFLYDTEMAASVSRGKSFLFPFGEYVPRFLVSSLSRLIAPEDLQKYLSQRVYSPDKAPFIYDFNGIRISTLICSEILSYTIIRDLAEQKPDIVFYQSSLTLFHESPLIEMHLLSFTKVAAAQMRTPVFQSTNNSISVVVNGRGQIISMQENGLHGLIYKADKDTIQQIR